MRKIKGEVEKLSVPAGRLVMPLLEASVNTSNEQFTAANHQLYPGDRVGSASSRLILRARLPFLSGSRPR
jgi:hypothetical protein